MIYTNIVKKPEKTVFGKFSIQVALSKTIEDFTEDNITLTGDTTGVEYNFNIISNSVVLQFKLPKDTSGKFTITTTGEVTNIETNETDTLEIVSTDIQYDTKKTITIEYGDPTYNNNEIKLPITFPEDIKILTKNHFNINFSSGKGKVLVYGSDRTFTLVLRYKHSTQGTITIDLVNPITKSTGISVSVDSDEQTIQYPKP